MTTVVSLKTQNQIGLIVIDNPPVNALSHAVRQQLMDCLDAAEHDDAVLAVVLQCNGRTFIAGADITEFGKPPLSPTLTELLARLDGFTKLTIAAIHGTALGGGLETALCCHHRICDSKTRLGLPESQLGLIPGAGGTQRLPRLVGVKAALDMMIEGKPVSAERALELGLVTKVVNAAQLSEAAVELAQSLLDKGAPLMRVSALPMAPTDQSFFEQYRNALRRKHRGFEAPLRIIKAVQAATTVGFVQAMAVERELFIESLNSTQSAAMRHLFFAERAAAKVTGISKDITPRAIEKIGVIGAGTMGAGIALACMSSGMAVTLLDNDEQGLARGTDTIDKLLGAQVAKKRIDAASAQRTRALLTTSCDYDDLADADLVVEAVFESMEVKEQVFKRLDTVCKAGAILATNTSTLDIDQIAAATGRPDDVIGLHFFSPANVMRLLEIVRGQKTSDQVIVSSLALAKRIGKVSVVVGNCFGFVGNRMLYGYGRENQLMLLQGAAPEYIDSVLTDFGFAMGPNAVGDLAGLDVGYKVRQARTDLPDDPAYYRIADMLAQRGRFGQKTGAGIYLYPSGSRTPQPDPEVQSMINAEAKRLGIEQRQISAEEILHRCVYALVAEGAQLLQDGIAARSGDIDVIWANGYGFPRYRGGPMFYADTVGTRAVYDSICEYQQRFGPQFWTPPALLAELARDNALFSDYQHSRA